MFKVSNMSETFAAKLWKVSPAFCPAAKPYKSLVKLFKACVVKERFAKREILALQKTQEGRKNYPVDDFSVGNPRRGFPYAEHQKPFISAFFLFAT